MLPSGRRVGLNDECARRAAQAQAKSESPHSLAHALLAQLSILRAPGVLMDERGEALDAMRLSLRDMHVLRAFVAWAGIVSEEQGEYACLNCGAAFSVAPSSLFETAPFVDAELHDADLDARFEFDAWHSIPPVRAGRRMARRIRLDDRSVEEALALWSALHLNPLPMTPALVLAMGIRALDREHRLSAMADALSGASPQAWDAIVNLFCDAHYSRRLWGLYRCAECGARNDVELPLEREFMGGGASLPFARKFFKREPFPDLDDFEKRVRKAAFEIYRRRGLKNIDLFVDAGVPACDEGGQPLLGSYEPGTPVDADMEIPRRPEIRIFYKSFEAEYQSDRGFDVDAEIKETIEHELVHHLHQLAGDDPLDEEERAEIALEHARIVGGKEVWRRSLKQMGGDFWGFVKATWFFWAALALLSKLMWCR